jgi:hypothetical protein
MLCCAAVRIHISSSPQQLARPCCAVLRSGFTLKATHSSLPATICGRCLYHAPGPCRTAWRSSAAASAPHSAAGNPTPPAAAAAAVRLGTQPAVPPAASPAGCFGLSNPFAAGYFSALGYEPARITSYPCHASRSAMRSRLLTCSHSTPCTLSHEPSHTTSTAHPAHSATNLLTQLAQHTQHTRPRTFSHN